MRKNNFFSFQKERKRKNLLLAGFFGISLLFGGLNAHAQDYETMKISSGFNEDVIAENSPAADHSTSPVDGTASGANYALMTTDYPNAITGLPVNRIINSATTTDLQFRMADYTENNSLRIASMNGDGTLEFEETVSALKLFILATSGNGNATFTGTIHFSDDSTQEISSQTVNDWYNSPDNIAIAGVGRVSRADGSVDNNTSNPKLFQIEITVEEENQDKEITQISFVKTSADGYLNIFGVSREFEADCPKPTGIAADNITPNSADLTWNEAADGTNWTIIYGEEGFNPEDEGTSEEVEDASFSIEDLLPNTVYEVYLQAHCSETEDSNIAGPFSFATACGSKDVPYIQDFENTITPDLPNCTAKETISGGKDWETRTQNEVYNMPSGFDGQVLVFPYTFSGQANAWFFTDGINLEAGVNYEISYKYGNGDASGAVEKMRVKMGTSASSEAMNTELADHPNITEVASETNYLVFTVENDGIYYFGFNAYSDSNQYFLFLDDISIDVGPTCPAPTDINFEYITDISAMVNFTSGQENTSWEIIYGEAGFDPETEGETLTTQETSGNLISGLTAETSYDVYVRAICGEELGEIAGPASFTTAITPPENTYLCDAIEIFANDACANGPYTNVDAFEEANEPFGECLNNFHGTNSVWFTFVATSDQAVVTTDFASTEFATEISVFAAPTDCTDMTTLGEEAGCAANGNDADLSGLIPGETYYIKITGFNNAAGEFCIEVQMDEPACPAPSDISFGEITENSAEVSWTSNGTETEWEVIYGLTGFDLETEGESILVTENPQVVLTDLEEDTQYDVYVRAICEEDEFSDWISGDFTTEEMGVAAYIFDNFTYYPNPTQGEITLKATEKIESIRIFNLLGQEVLNLTPIQTQTQLDLHQLQPAVYLMEVSINGTSKTFRVVKK